MTSRSLALALAGILAASPAAALNLQGRRVILPSVWAAAAPAVAIDCLTGGGTAGLTTTRASVGLADNAAGVWAQFATNALRRTDKGCLIEETRTNRALQSRNFTQAAWVKTNMTAALDQTGIDNTASAASSLTATGANATALQAIADATARNRTTSAFVKRLAGTGEVDMTMDGGATWTPIAPCPLATFIGNCRVSLPPAASVVNPSVGFRLVTSGDQIAVDVFQTEDAGASVTSPIITTSAVVARNTDVVSQTTALPSFQNTFTWAGSGVFRYPMTAANFPSIATLEFGAVANRSAFSAAQTGNTFLKLGRAGGSGAVGSAYDFIDGPAPGLGAMAQSRDGQNNAEWVANTHALATGYPFLTPNSYAAPMNRLDVGSIGGGSSLNGYVRRIWVWPNIVLTRDQLRAVGRLVR